MVSHGRSSIPRDIHPDTLSLANLLGELAQFPGTALTMKEICDRILDRIIPVFNCEGCWLLTPSRVDNKLELRAWRGLNPASINDLRWISNEEGVFEPIAKQAVWDFGIDDAPTNLVWPDKAFGRIAVSPMQSQDRCVGSIVLFFHGSRALTTRHKMLLTSFSSQAGLVIRSVDLLLASQELVLQQERNRIAREIHDGVSQNLALLMLKMEIISRLSESDPSRMKTELKKVMEILESSVYELRRSIYALRSPGLAGLGLLPAVKKLARDFTEQTDIDVELSLPAGLSLPPDAQSVVFSVIQERLDVIGKAGNLTRVSIEIEAIEERITVSLTDDGTLESHQPASPDYPAPLWQQRIGDRVRPFGGAVFIHNNPPNTVIQIAMPLR